MSKITVTVGIAALNEEANIQNVIKRILSQKTTNYELVEIWVASDGSTDSTVEKVKELNDLRVHIIDSKERKGKLKRVNEMVQLAQGEIYVSIDADTIPENDETLNNLVTPFIKDPKLAYVSAAMRALKPKTFMEQAMLVSRSVWDKIRLELKGGNSVYTVHGGLYALRTSFAKAYPFPESVWADIGFHYFTCLKQGYKYESVKNAVVLFRLPSTVKDQMSQMKRYKREDQAMKDYFGDCIETEYYIPKSMLYKYKLLAFLRYPIHCTAIFALNFVNKYLSGKAKNQAVATWQTAASTKGAITNG